METCPDCTYVEEQVKGNNQYEVIDIGQHVRDLKAFLRLRDHHPAFNEAKSVGVVGIPCFVLTLSKILCKWKQDSVVSLFLYLDSVFKHKHKLIHNQAPVMNRLCPFLLNLHK